MRAARSVEGLTSSAPTTTSRSTEHFPLLALRLDRSRAASSRSTRSRPGSAQSRSSRRSSAGSSALCAQQKPANESGRAAPRALAPDRPRGEGLARQDRRPRGGAPHRGRGRGPPDFDARLQAQLDEARRAAAAVRGSAGGCSRGAGRCRGETRRAPCRDRLAGGRLDELFGLRHADAQVARVANERLAARLRRISASQADEGTWTAHDGCRGSPSMEQLDSSGEAATRAIERAVLEGLADLGRKLTAKAPRSRASRARGSGVRSIRSERRSPPPMPGSPARLRRLEAERLRPAGGGPQAFDQRTCVT